MQGCRHARLRTPHARAAGRSTDGMGTTIFAEMSALALATGLGQPRPGLPRHRRSGRGRRGRDRRHPRRGTTSTPRARASPTCAWRSPSTSNGSMAWLSTLTPRSWSPRVRPRRSPRRCSAWSTPATRWSRSSRSTTPTRLHRDGRWAQGAGDAARARLPSGRRPAARRGDRPHPADPAQHAAQPDRHGADPDELQAVADLAIERDLLVVTDEVYEHMTYDVAHRPDCHAAGHGERTLPSARPARRSRSPDGRSAGRPVRHRWCARC